VSDSQAEHYTLMLAHPATNPQTKVAAACALRKKHYALIFGNNHNDTCHKGAVMLQGPGFLNTNATLLSDISLVMYILVLAPAMIVGFIFARRKMFEPYHKYTMTAITLLNWVLISVLMAVQYSAATRFSAPTSPALLLPTIHALFGGTAQLLATYLVLRMWFEKVLPQWIMVKNIKVYMRLTLALWAVTVFLGFSTYFMWYGAPFAGARAGEVATTQEAPAATPEAGTPSVVTPEVGATTIATPEADATTVATVEAPAATPEVATTPEAAATP
jgi:uncharacterized membrane protein YozB (DUF420 family)